MSEVVDTHPKQATFGLSTLFIVFTLISVLFGGYSVLVKWWRAPRIANWQARNLLAPEFPLGTPRSEVEQSLKQRYRRLMRFDEDFDEPGIIECWIMDTGHPMALIPDDIRVQFLFDEHGQLSELSVETESRF